MAFVGPYTFPQATSLQLPFWSLELNNWGNQGTGSDPFSSVYSLGGGLLPGGSQYITIGPKSTADGATIGYQAINPGAPNVFAETFIGLNTPLYSMLGPLDVQVSPNTIFNNAYRRDGDPTSRAFGGLLGGRFERPFLHLLFYRQVPSIPPTATRVDLARGIFVDAANIVPGSEQLVQILPVMGRTCKSVFVTASGFTLNVSIRVAAISSSFGSPIEQTIATGTVNGVTGDNWSTSFNLPCSFLAVYYTFVSGAGNLDGIVTAKDCDCGSFTAPP